MSSVKPMIMVWSVASSMPALAVLPTGGSAAASPSSCRRAHRLLDQLEGLLDGALDHQGAQVGIGLLLQLGERWPG